MSLGPHPEGSQHRLSFLGLPAEIRHNIYRLLLGGRTLHCRSYAQTVPIRYPSLANPFLRPCSRSIVTAGDRPLSKDLFCKFLLCCADKSDEVYFSHGTYVGAREAETADWRSIGIEDWMEGRHQDCLTSIAKARVFSLDLLLVCKQIYEEASLAPFTENTFVFRFPDTLFTFCHSLTESQMAAVRTITLYQLGALRAWWHNSICNQWYQEQKLSTMTGLHTVNIYIELVDHDFLPTRSRPGFRMTDEAGQDELIGGFRILPRVELRRVRVVILHSFNPPRCFRPGVPTDEALTLWAKRIKRFLLPPTTQTE